MPPAYPVLGQTFELCKWYPKDSITFVRSCSNIKKLNDTKGGHDSGSEKGSDGDKAPLKIVAKDGKLVVTPDPKPTDTEEKDTDVIVKQKKIELESKTGKVTVTSVLKDDKLDKIVIEKVDNNEAKVGNLTKKATDFAAEAAKQIRVILTAIYEIENNLNISHVFIEGSC